MMPVFRAKNINSDEYVVGYYVKTTNPKQLMDENEPTFVHKIIESWNLINEEIDPTTLAIHFPDMLDSQGSKIFASLSEDGKGGDILDRNGMTFKTIYKSVNGRFEAYENDGMHHLLAHKFHQSKVIGIQQ